jgi:hypothetical protein
MNSKLPISLGWKAGNPIRVDKLPPLQGIYAIHQHLTEKPGSAHIKLEYGDTPYVLSLFVYDIEKFFRHERVRVRSYDLWPKEILFEAYVLKDGKKVPHPKSGGKIYREDAVIIDEGRYKWQPPVITFYSSTRNLTLAYKIIYLRTLRYHSPKYGYSVRTEYIFEPVENQSERQKTLG